VSVVGGECGVRGKRVVGGGGGGGGGERETEGGCQNVCVYECFVVMRCAP